MTSSPLSIFFGDSSPEEYNNGLNHAEPGLPMFDLLDKQLQKQEQGLPYIKPLPRVELLCNFLARQASSVFSQIAEAEKRNVLFGKANKLGSVEREAPIDMRMDKIDYSSCSIHVALVPKDLPHHIQLFRIVLSIENGISSVHSIDSSAMRLADGRVKDMKFAHNNTLLVLWDTNGKTSLLSIPYRQPQDTSGEKHSGTYHMSYGPHMFNVGLPNTVALNDKEVLNLFCKHRVPTEGSFVPERMEIRTRNGKNDKDAKRIIFLGKDRLHYKVFRLPDANSVPRKPDEDISMS